MADPSEPAPASRLVGGEYLLNGVAEHQIGVADDPRDGRTARSIERVGLTGHEPGLPHRLHVLGAVGVVVRHALGEHGLDHVVAAGQVLQQLRREVGADAPVPQVMVGSTITRSGSTASSRVVPAIRTGSDPSSHPPSREQTLQLSGPLHWTRGSCLSLSTNGEGVDGGLMGGAVVAVQEHGLAVPVVARQWLIETHVADSGVERWRPRSGGHVAHRAAVEVDVHAGFRSGGGADQGRTAVGCGRRPPTRPGR